MKCANCGSENPPFARFCGNCGSTLAAPAPPPPPGEGAEAPTLQQQEPPPASPVGGALPTRDDLASWGQRIGSWGIDFGLGVVLGLIPIIGNVLGFALTIVNFVMYRRGNTVGLRLVGARIVRQNGDVSGFFHTAVRAAASLLSALPLGLGYWWAFWDPMRQTWHDKLMHTYVLRDTPELAEWRGTSSRTPVVLFWVLLVGLIALTVLAIIVVLAVLAIFAL